MHKKILVVDDEIDLQKVIKQILSNEGYEVITASTGEEALEKVRDEAPDLVVLDINLPGMSGYEVCKEIRNDPIYKRLPIVMLTVRRERKDKIKGMDLGTDEYMTKPFHPRELLLRIKNLLK